MPNNLSDVSIVIPAYKPDERIHDLINQLSELGFDDFIVVDDGSGSKYADVFKVIEKREDVTLLNHEINRGKGAALQTAFTYFSEARNGKIGLVTADADGQHLPADIARCAEKMIQTGKVILGSRDFSGDNIPARSKTGNRITSIVFHLFFGMKISDTQTGLRAIPSEYVESALCAHGDRYEFETNVLLILKKRNIPYEELKIETVYLDNNSSSHFRVFRDSVRIYSTILRFVTSSLASSLIDYILFLLIHIIFSIGDGIGETFICCMVSRGIATTVNYFINVNAVFNKEKSRHAMLRYFALAIPLMLISATFISVIGKRLEVFNPYLKTLIKMVVDTTLFFASFRIQHQWVFNSGKK